MKPLNVIRGIWSFYVDGFRNMTVGKSLWVLIIVKLVILFTVFKLFFFPDVLQSNYSTDAERADAVRQSLLHDRPASGTNNE